ncbi:MAG: NADH-quinone oxidoreductase subunit C [Chloroflexi bacterium]|nr:NADH-quinone oxidoreductase subunit C [Chloroflexota bacterium]
MTEQQPNGGDAPAEKPAADAPAAEAPAHRGPPIVVAEEVLNELGVATAAALKGALGKLAVESGGRDDIPWARVEAKDLHGAAKACRDGELGMDMLHLMLAVDWVERIQMVYVLQSMEDSRKVILKVDLPAESPAVATVTDLWQAAGWYERETHDLFGVVFTGNDDLAPLLLYEEFEGHPGLKSYPLNDYETW